MRLPTYSAMETCSCGAMTTQEAGMSSILKDRLDEFRAAHAGCRVPPGPCMEMFHSNPILKPAFCSLLHGHKGAHTNGQASWTDLPNSAPAPAGTQEETSQ